MLKRRNNIIVYIYIKKKNSSKKNKLTRGKIPKNKTADIIEKVQVVE